MWWFRPKRDDRGPCITCQTYADNQFSGDFLRSTFPYLNIVDEDTIEALVHPNCRCYLSRLKNKGDEKE
jgi:hypothetical protein